MLFLADIAEEPYLSELPVFLLDAQQASEWFVWGTMCITLFAYLINTIMSDSILEKFISTIIVSTILLVTVPNLSNIENSIEETTTNDILIYSESLEKLLDVTFSESLTKENIESLYNQESINVEYVSNETDETGIFVIEKVSFFNVEIRSEK